MRVWARLAVLGLCCAAPAALAESIFDFESIAPGSALPMTMSVNGLVASFSGDAAVCPTVGLSGNMFVSLSGNAIVQGFCNPTTTGAPLAITFSRALSKVSFAVAINGTSPATVTVTYLQNGTPVGTQTIEPVIPDGAISPEAAVSYTGNFNSVMLSSAGLLALDNLDAVPAS